MTDATTDDWFNTSPTKDELHQMQDAMLEHFSAKPIGAKKPEDLTETILDIIDILVHTQLFWTEAKGRDLTTTKKRYLSLYDQVRRAYTNIPATKKKVNQFIEDQEAAMRKVKESAAKSHHDDLFSNMDKIPAKAELDEQKKEIMIDTVFVTNDLKTADQFNNKHIQFLSDAVVENLHLLVDTHTAIEIRRLKKTVARQNAVLTKMSHSFKNH